MTAPPATRPPRPTVRKHRPDPSRALARVAPGALMAAFFAAVSAWMLGLHQVAVLIAVLGVSAAAAAGIAAAVLATRRPTFNPALPALVLAALLGAAGWWGFPGLRWPVLTVDGLIGYALLRWARLVYLRMKAHARMAQVLTEEVSSPRSQTEQVAAGLTGQIDERRVYEPNLGVAEHAAHSLRVTKWDKARIREAELILPWLPKIRDPDLTTRIRAAITDRYADAVDVELKTDPSRDMITIKILDEARAEEETTDVVTRAKERVEKVLEKVLAGAKVTDVEIDEDAAPEPAAAAATSTAGAGHVLKAFTLDFDTTTKVYGEEGRKKVDDVLSVLLFGVPDRLRSHWQPDLDRVSFRRRRDFPDIIPHRVLDLAEQFGDQVVLAFAEDEDGEVVVYPLSKTVLPHGLVIGKTGGGKTVLLVTLAIEAARLGVEVWGCDPKRIELMGLRGWPNITKIATEPHDMIELVEQFHAEMLHRYELIETGKARARDFRRLLLILDEYYVFCMFVADWWAEQEARQERGAPKIHPVIAKIGQIAAMSRSANMHMVIGTQRPDATWFHEGARDNFGFRVSLGPLSQQAAQMLWGDAHTGTDVPAVQGLCTATTAHGPVRAKVHFTPNPADALTGDLSDAELEQLRSLLPAGTSWDGPLPADAPDPGFEASVGVKRVRDADPVTALLTLVQGALRGGMAYLTDGTTRGPPRPAEARPQLGWGLSPSGLPEPRGTWTGCLTSTSDGPRVYLHPGRACQVAKAWAEELGVPFNRRPDSLADALGRAGLIRTEKAKDGIRTSHRVPLPGNDLKEDRPRAWDMAADTLLGDLPEGDMEPEPGQQLAPDEPSGDAGQAGAAAGSDDLDWDDDTGGDLAIPGLGDDLDLGLDLDAGDHLPSPPPAPRLRPGVRPWSPAADLRDRDRIILPPAAEHSKTEETVMAYVIGRPDSSRGAGTVTIDYVLDGDGTPGTFRVPADERIYLAR